MNSFIFRDCNAIVSSPVFHWTHIIKSARYPDDQIALRDLAMITVMVWIRVRVNVNPNPNPPHPGPVDRAALSFYQ